MSAPEVRASERLPPRASLLGEWEVDSVAVEEGVLEVSPEVEETVAAVEEGGIGKPMSTSFFKSKKFEERRHLIGGIALLSMLFFGNYMPIIVTLLLLLGVALMAIYTFSGFRTAVLISVAAFFLEFTILYLRHYTTFNGVVINLWESLELSLVTSLFFSMLFGAFVWVRALLRRKRAGFDEVVGAFNLYIWIAVIYACLYTFVSKEDLKAFHLDDQLVKGMDMKDWMKNFNDLFYFSFCTQTTLGYGDIVPVSHFARALAVTQAMIGQFYVAVVLTYILNLWIQNLGKQVIKAPDVKSD